MFLSSTDKILDSEPVIGPPLSHEACCFVLGSVFGPAFVNQVNQLHSVDVLVSG